MGAALRPTPAYAAQMTPEAVTTLEPKETSALSAQVDESLARLEALKHTLEKTQRAPARLLSVYGRKHSRPAFRIMACLPHHLRMNSPLRRKAPMRGLRPRAGWKPALPARFTNIDILLYAMNCEIRYYSC